MMKFPSFIIPAMLPLLILACRKQEQPEPQPEMELSVPEKVEKEIAAVLSKDWKSLVDTLDYFDSTMLSKGQTKGKGPDGVYYELDVRILVESGLSASFKIEDSTWAAINGKIIPLSLDLTAGDTRIAIKKESADSTSLSVSCVKVIVPSGFLTDTEHQAPLLYKEERVGYLTRNELENTDYSTGTYIIIHYYNDPRTFAIYDNGLTGLLGRNLVDVTI